MKGVGRVSRKAILFVTILDLDFTREYLATPKIPDTGHPTPENRHPGFETTYPAEIGI
jgi:hypothetical protein